MSQMGPAIGPRRRTDPVWERKYDTDFEANDQSFRMYMSAVDQYYQDRELYWTRVSAFLVIQGFLFASLSLAESIPPIVLLLGSFGLLFSAIWYVVMELGLENILSQRDIIDKIERELELKFPLLEMNAEYPTDRRSLLTRSVLGSNSAPELYLPIITGLFWIAVLVYFAGILELGFPSIGGV